MAPRHRRLRLLLDLASQLPHDGQTLGQELDLDVVLADLKVEQPLRQPKLWSCPYLDLPKPALPLVDDSQHEVGHHQGSAQHRAMPGCDQGLSESLLLIPPCSGDKSASGFRIPRLFRQDYGSKYF